MELPIKILIFGKSNSGKTHLLVNELLLNRFNKKFHKVFLFCPTYNSIKNKKHYESEGLGLDKSRIIPKYDENAMKTIWKLKKINSTIENEHWLIIMDDLQSEPEFDKNKRDSMINLLACKGRHRNISLIILSQTITGIGTVMRKATDEIYLFPAGNHKELMSFYEEFGRGTRQDFIRFLQMNNNNWVHLKNYVDTSEKNIIDYDDIYNETSHIYTEDSETE